MVEAMRHEPCYFSPQEVTETSDHRGEKTMTILTGVLIYLAVVAAILLFFRHVRSCDDNMRAAFIESLAAKQGSPRGSSLPVIHRAS